MMRRIGLTLLLPLLMVTGLSAWCFLSPAHPPQLKPSVDQIVVDKRAHRMQLLRQGVVVKTYQVALGRGGMGNKSRQGDNRVPEGAYRIAGRNPHSAFHLSLHIGYPTQEQARAAAAAGIDPGGDVMIHGLRRGLGWLGPWQNRIDWTRGCIAVTDGEIEEIWAMVPDGTPILIRP